MKLFSLIVLAAVAMSSLAQARGGRGGGVSFSGDSSIGISLILTSPSQDDLNGVIDYNNATQSRATDKLGTGYELALNYQNRFNGTIFALQFRPSYFTQSSSGSGYDTKLTGYTFFPMLRIYPLENGFIHFFMQTGVGYGKLNGTMSGPLGSVSWSGDGFGMMGGIGAEFMFGADQAIVIEGNLRYMPIPRNIASTVSGAPTGFSRVAGGYELETNNSDVKTTLSGVQGIIGYQLMF